MKLYICDSLIDEKEKADKAGSQKIASLHASAFAFEVLAKSYIEPVVLEQHKYPEKLPTELTDVFDKQIEESNLDIPVFLDKSIQNAEICKSLENYDFPKTFLSPSTCMEFALIPAGKFTMGSSQRSGSLGFIRDIIKNVEFPAHEVTIKNCFYLGKFSVTQKQWNTVMDKNPSKVL